jgi:hypothetical protein
MILKLKIGIVCFMLLFPILLKAQDTSHSWVDETDFPIYLTIIGEANASIAAHSVILSIDTNSSTPTNFALTKHGIGTPVNIPELNLHTTPFYEDTNPGDEFSGKIIEFEETGANIYTLTITQKKLAVPGGTISSDEDWVLEIYGLPASNSVDVTTECLNRLNISGDDYGDLNIPPTATISNPASNQTINEADSVTFAGTVTDDDTASLDHGWDYSGGTTSDAVEDPGSKTFNTEGEYLVTYTVTDDVGQVATDTVTITVNSTPADDPPTANISTTPDPPEEIFHFEITFDGSGSSDDGTVMEYHWDFGDGSAAPATSEITPSHTYLTGEYTASLIVTDDATIPQNSDPFEVTVKVYPDQEISFPPHRGVPYASDPPTIDGEIMPEEWRGTHRVTYSTGAPPADVAFQGLKHRTDDYLFLAFEVKKDQDFDEDDLIILTFRPDAAFPVPANDLKLFIFPFGAGHVVGDNQNLEEIRIWKDSDGWPTELTPAQVTAIGIESKMKSHIYDTHEAWDIELKIPTSAVTADWVDFSDNFLFYFNVSKVNSVPPPPPAPQVPTNIQFTWPIGVPVVTGDILAYDFDPDWWGRGNASGTAVLKGVYIERSDFGTTNAPQSRILLPDTDPGSVINTFFATVKNDSEMETTTAPDYSTPVIAEDIRVRFRIANWGIPSPSDWRDLPATTGIDPAAPAGMTITPVQDVPAAAAGVPGEATYNLTWTIDRPSPDYTAYSANTHQCILVEIDSTGTANIKIRSTYRNMNFGYASEFSQPAEISVRGLGAPPEGKDEHTYLLVITPHDLGIIKQSQTPRLTHVDPGSNEGGVTARGSIEWAAHGFLYTGEYVIINGISYEILKPVGSFGHVVTHVGEVVDWEYEIEDARKVDENLYIVGVPEESSVFITPVIRPVEFWPNSLSIHAGSVTPIGTLATNYGTGFTAFADFGRRINKQLMVMLFAGINRFPSKTMALPYWNISANIDVRYLLPLRGSLTPYIQAGPGAYYDDSGNFSFGVNTGLGFWYDFNSHLHAEIGVDYHVMMSPTTQFLSAHAGIVYKF